MKYQIILSSDEVLDDQTFYELFDGLDIWDTSDKRPKFKMIDARSLEGIREEVWKKKEELKNDLKLGDIGVNKLETTFEDLNDLFNL